MSARGRGREESSTMPRRHQPKNKHSAESGVTGRATSARRRSNGPRGVYERHKGRQWHRDTAQSTGEEGRRSAHAPLGISVLGRKPCVVCVGRLLRSNGLFVFLDGRMCPLSCLSGSVNWGAGGGFYSFFGDRKAPRGK